MTAVRPAILDLGFRPFFLLATLAAIAPMSYWLHLQATGTTPSGPFTPTAWHAHEMIFGYVGAVVAGFLLTASANWTGRPTLRGPWLAGAAGLWLAGRVAVNAATDASLAVAAIDVFFLAVLAPYLGFVLARAGKVENLPMAAVVAALALTNAAMHVGALRQDPTLQQLAARLGVYLLVLLVVVIGGRVIPFFTSRRIAGSAPRQHVALDAAAIASVIALAAAHVFEHPQAIAWIAAAGALIHLARLAGWVVRGVAAEPMLWVLFLGYAWIAVGFALSVSPSTRWLAVHAWTAGAVGSVTMGMMLRVSLGHTGREIRAAPTAVAAFVLVNASAAIRVAGPLAVPERFLGWIVASGVCWILAFSALLFLLAPILVAPRADASKE